MHFKKCNLCHLNMAFGRYAIDCHGYGNLGIKNEKRNVQKEKDLQSD